MTMEIILKLWYLWLLIIVAGVFSLFGPKIKGFLGETAVSTRLARLDEGKYKIINNIMLQVGNKTTQIDHLVVSNYGVFVIETKNYKGWITGNEFDDRWRQTIYKRKEFLNNPIKQNYGHVQALKEILGDFKDINYIPIVAFTTNADLKVKTKTPVVYTVKLLKTIKEYRDETITDLKKEKIYQKLLSLNVDNKENRKAHVKAIHKNVSEKNSKVNKDICPRCGAQLVVRNGKYGKFKGCSSYPKCRFTAEA